MFGAVSQPLGTLNEKIHRAFNSIDSDKDGFITVDDFTGYLASTGLPPLPMFTDCFTQTDTNNSGLIAASQFKTLLIHLLESLSAMGQGLTVEQFRENFSALLSEKSKTETSHTIDVKVGDTTHLNTKLELKFLMNDADEEKHFTHITQGLNYHEQTVGIIFRLVCAEPEKVEEKLKELIEQVKGLVEGMCPPESIPAKIFNALEFETAHDDVRVTIAIKVSDECDNFYLLGYLAFLEKYYSQIAGSTQMILGFKNDLHSLLADDADIIKILGQGLLLGVHTKTNCSAISRKILDSPFYKTLPFAQYISTFGKMFMQDGFKFELAFDGIEFADFFAKDKQYHAVSPFQKSIVSGIAGGIMMSKALPQQVPIPVLQDLYSFLHTHFKANFSFSFTFPKFVTTLHFKTSGIKELQEKFVEKNMALTNQPNQFE